MPQARQVETQSEQQGLAFYGRLEQVPRTYKTGPRYACLWKSALYPQAFDPFKMPAIVREQRYVVTQRRSSDEQIKIADKLSGAPQQATELPKTPAYFLVDAQDDDAGKEFGEHRLTPGGFL
jgi:hypothetical protein